MNAMKYNRILWIVLSVFCIASCADFLTEAPTTQLSEETLFADEANVEASLVGVYNGLVSGGHGAYMKQQFEFGGFPSRLITQKDNRTTDEYTQCQMLTLFPNVSHNENIYDFFYACISKCNKFIDGIQSSPVDQRYKDIREGEVRLIRATQYFSLVRYYGDTPLILHAPTTAAEADAPRASYMDVYKQILVDLTEAERLMRSPDEPVQTLASARPHKWAATAFKAAVYVQIASIIEGQDNHFFDLSKRPERRPNFSDIGIETAADAWQKALDAAEAVIQSGAYELAPSFADLYKWGLDAPATYNLKERIFAIQATTKFGSSNLTQRTVPADYFKEGKNNNHGRIRPARYVLWKWCEVHGGTRWTGRSDGLTNLYKACKDPRYDISYIHTKFMRNSGSSAGKTRNCYPGTGDGVKSHTYWEAYFNKYQDPQYVENSSSGQADFYLMRYAEVFLLAAEAAASLSNGLGDANWEKAMGYMEVIHKRARDSKSGATSPTMANWDAKTPQELVDAIMWERLFEMHGEGHEFFDPRRRGAEWMVRWFSKPYNEFMKQPEQHYNNGTTVGYNYFDRTFYARPLIEDVQQIRASLLFAFPEKEFRNNGGISESDQNDFYWYTVTPTIPATLDEAGLQ